MMPMPGAPGAVRITVIRVTVDGWGDETLADSHQIDGCMEYRAGSNETTAGGQDVLSDYRTLLLPPGSDLGYTDRVLIHPPGVDIVPANDKATRRANTYQVQGRPVDWTNPLTGWSPGMQADLLKVV